MGSVTVYPHPQLKFANAELDPVKHTLSCEGKTVYLRNKLWRVLQALILTEGELLTRHQLIDDVWRGNYYTGQAGLTHSICHLRKLFEDLGIAAEISTVPKSGYILEIESKTVPTSKTALYHSAQNQPNTQVTPMSHRKA